MKLKKLLIIALMLITLSACNFSTSSLKSISIVGEDSIEVNQEIMLTITTEPSNITTSVNWSSNDDSIATVDENGNVKGVGVGTATITAVSKDNSDISAKFEIEVTEVVIESIFVGGLSQVYVGSTITLNYTVFPEYAPQNVVFSSNDEEIATVNDQGVVTGVSTGQVAIIATSTIDETITKEFVVTVINAPLEEITIEGISEVDVDTVVILKVLSNEIDVTNLVVFTSNNTEVATVDDNGKVTALSEGTVTIKATSKQNINVFDEFVITVSKPAFQYYDSKVLVLDKENQRLELLNVPATTYDDQTTFLKKDGTLVTEGSIDDIYVGMDNIYVKVNYETNTITSILIDGKTGFSNIRVGIRYSINDISKDETLYHDSVIFALYSDATLQTFDGSKQKSLADGTVLIISIDGEDMVVKQGRIEIFRSNKRIIINPTKADDAIKFSSISRGSDELYSGNMEVSIRNKRLLVVNDVNLEKYLYKVVPSEMPSSYHAEALKAQAIAARTYAYKDIFNRTYEHLGYTVDDSVMSQVYNNTNPKTTTNAAVDATKGIVMMNNGELISAFYSSTSSGLTASAHEVWISDGFNYPEPTPYLIGQNLTQDENGNPIPYDYQDEASMLNFFKRIQMTTPDSSVSFHRWKVTFSNSQMTETVDTNLKLMYQATPDLVLTETTSGWASLPIPSSIGQVENIYVSERGTSGVVMSVVVETTTGKYKIINQYNIRFTLRPSQVGATVTRYTGTGSSSTYNSSILLSGFFAIEYGSSSYTFYGGGNGHGVGMSQNGANGLAKTGSRYDQILTTYYSEIDMIDITYFYNPITDFKNYFN